MIIIECFVVERKVVVSGRETNWEKGWPGGRE